MHACITYVCVKFVLHCIYNGVYIVVVERVRWVVVVFLSKYGTTAAASHSDIKSCEGAPLCHNISYKKQNLFKKCWNKLAQQCKEIKLVQKEQEPKLAKKVLKQTRQKNVYDFPHKGLK